MRMRDALLEQNVGGYDLYLRTIIGLVFIIGLSMDYFIGWQWLAALIGFVGLFTAITRHCTLYNVLGYSTAKG